ncbi:MAG: hypothetical protein SFY80_15210 [Verrucomicrobiota bacterium]|nr:hypothetical protein [Verrucomicrobiota bacterium]
MINTVRGESFVGGFLAGFAGSYVTHAGFSKDCGRFEYAMSGAVVGGTAEAIGGGKFENGAVTGAFVGLFNAGHEPH